MVVLVKLFERSHPEAEVDEAEIENKAAERRLALVVDDESSDGQSHSEDSDFIEDAESTKSDSDEYNSQTDATKVLSLIPPLAHPTHGPTNCMTATSKTPPPPGSAPLPA